MLWADLDVGKMMTSTEETGNKLKKLKHLKHLPTYELVDKEIQGFFNSLPLMKELKGEALRCATRLTRAALRSLLRALCWALVTARRVCVRGCAPPVVRRAGSGTGRSSWR